MIDLKQASVRKQEAFAELICNDMDPDEVTRRLGISPDASHRKGDLTPQGTAWKLDHWELTEQETGIPPEEDYAEAVERCLDRLLQRIAREDILQKLAEISAQASLSVGVYGNCRETPKLYYSPETIRILARIGASLDEDFYPVYTGEDDEEE